MSINALAQWYGGDRMICDAIGKQLDGCEWVGIPFAGGMSAIKAIRARTIVANDLHRGVISLANYVKAEPSRKYLESFLREQLFHPDELSRSQAMLADPESDAFQQAVAFFTVAWMCRSGTAGTTAEETAGLSIRWEAGGGDSAKRYHSAIDSLSEWCEEFKRCTFQCLDAFDFLAKCKDRKKHGLYVDAPFPGPGDKYKHQFDEHEELMQVLEYFKQTKVVIRYYDTPMIRELYREPNWTWHPLKGRKQTNAVAPEVLITN